MITLKWFLVPSPGDWLSWYYIKKILVDASYESLLLYLIPEHRPFHVTLNAHKTLVNLCRFCFAKLHLFNSALLEKPKSDRVAVLVSAAFLEWLTLHSKSFKSFDTVLTLSKPAYFNYLRSFHWYFSTTLLYFLEALNLETTCPY